MSFIVTDLCSSFRNPKLFTVQVAIDHKSFQV
jgi:hypothetical protein